MVEDYKLDDKEAIYFYNKLDDFLLDYSYMCKLGSYMTNCYMRFPKELVEQFKKTSNWRPDYLITAETGVGCDLNMPCGVTVHVEYLQTKW